MFKKLLITTLAAGSIFATADIASAQVVTSGEVSCRADGVTDISMDARYRVRRGRRTFDASFEAAPNAGYTVGQRLIVTVANVRVGAMTLARDPANGDIAGDLEFDSNLAEGNPFPATFPAVRVGTKVTVGPLACRVR
jgi:hypothetical protein